MKPSKPLPLTREDLDVIEFIAKRLRADDRERSGIVARARAHQMQDDGNEHVTTTHPRPTTIKAAATADILMRIGQLQEIQKQNSPESKAWHDASAELQPLFSEMAMRNRVVSQREGKK